MLTRRTLLLTAAAALASSHVPWAVAQAAAGDAGSFVNQTGQALAGVVNSEGAAADKKARLAAIVEQSVAVDEVARFCLGRFWRAASPQQQQEYVRLFHGVLIASVTGHLGDYRGVTFTIGRTVPSEGNESVQSVVVRPGNAPNQVAWIVARTAAGPKIVDVVAEGTSLRLTQREDYASFLTRNGGNVQALIEAMRRQASA